MAKKARKTPEPVSETTQDIAMSDSPTDTDSAKIKVAGLIFAVPQPYTEGHVLTSIEASVLNQTFGENLRNNFAPRVEAFRKEKPEGYELTQEDIEALQTKFSEYAAGYTFAARGTRQPVDPVQREAERLANVAIRTALSSKNLTPKDVGKEKMEELVAGLLARNPAYMAEARKRVEMAKEMATTTLESLDL